VGPDTGKHIRNIAIVLALSVAVWLVPGGGTASSTIYNVLMVVFTAGLLFFGYRLYMEHRMTLFSLDDRMRGLLYGSLALATITVVATSRMWDEGGLGGMAWLVLLAIAAWGLVVVWRASREY
jgi:hypothetical protein